MRRRSLLAMPLGALAAPAVRAGGTYPSRAVTITVGFSPGGLTDLTARQLAEYAYRQLGVPVVIDNRPGAGATIAAGRVAQSRPDGYTLAIISGSPFTIAPHLQRLPYDPMKDFTFIGRYAVSPTPAYVLTESRFRTWQEVLDFARDKPEELRWTTAAPRGGPHIATAAAFAHLGLQTTYVPFGAMADALAALLGGTIDMAVSTDYPALLEAGKVRLLAEVGTDRLAGMEALPTFGELGYPLALQTAFGLGGPAGLPGEVVSRWQALLQGVIATPEWNALLRRFYTVSAFEPAADYARRLQREFDAAGEQIRMLNLAL